MFFLYGIFSVCMTRLFMMYSLILFDVMIMVAIGIKIMKHILSYICTSTFCCVFIF